MIKILPFYIRYSQTGVVIAHKILIFLPKLFENPKKYYIIYTVNCRQPSLADSNQQFGPEYKKENHIC